MNIFDFVLDLTNAVQRKCDNLDSSNMIAVLPGLHCLLRACDDSVGFCALFGLPSADEPTAQSLVCTAKA